MKNQAYRMTMLYDFYGELLTERQKEFYDLYYNEDLSLAEIAELNGITRQGVRDVIVRAEGILNEMEDKTGLIKRFYYVRERAQDIRISLGGIMALNENQYQNDALEALCLQIRGSVDALLKE